ncbi:MAG: CapA family protein [Pyrinomonadaceae bacterium]|nr:CapA family protein [Pyrinomonadaceae bacterium]
MSTETNPPSKKTDFPDTGVGIDLELQNKSSSLVEVLFTGDISHGENYQSKNYGKSNVLCDKGYDYSLEKMKDMLYSVDLAIGNLETPLTDLPLSPFHGIKFYVHWSDIELSPAALRAHNIRVVSLANNHTMDYSLDGLYQTLEVLEKFGFKYFGAGKNIREAAKPFISRLMIDGKSFTFAVIGAFQELKNYREDYDAYATETHGGINPLNFELLEETVRTIKSGYPDAFIVFFPHWGKNYKWKTERQVLIAERITATGVDVIIGHGAHMLQELEKRNDRWVAFGIGNFMFNSQGRYFQKNAPPFSLIAAMRIYHDGKAFRVHFRFYPVMTDNLLTNYQTRFVDASQFDEVCRLLEDKNTSPETPLDEIGRGQDERGYFLEIKAK